LEKLKMIKRLLEIKSTGSFDKCIDFAIEKFTDSFDHRIKQLLYNFPPEYTNPDGSKFWSGSKRTPNALVYNADESLDFNYVSSYSFLIAQALQIKQETSDYVKSYSSKIKVPEFAPKKVYIKANENDTNSNPDFDIGKDEEEQIEKVSEEIKHYVNKIKSSEIKAHEFEKDDDTNYHIDFIYAASNLRAKNYRINEADRQKTKMIAGKIIPAIATTTAAVTGLVALQLYTLFQTNDITFMRGAYVNLAVNLFVLTEPAPKIEHQDKAYDPLLLGPVIAVPPKWTVWDKITVNGPLTFREFIKFLKDTYKVDVNIITCSKVTLIQTFVKGNLDRLDTKIEDLYIKLAQNPLSEKTNYLILEISADGEKGESAIMPGVQYVFRK